MYRKYWLPELLIVLAAMLATTAIFWSTDLDIRIEGLFYEPGTQENQWPLGGALPFRFLYDLIPFLTAGMAILGIGLIVAGFLNKGRGNLRIYGVFIFLTLALGPGLLVNTVFKENWGRPRPKQITEFSGEMRYLPPGVKGINEMARSFPSGHSSVGFALCVFYFIFRRRNRKVAYAMLAASIAFGSLVGLARMAAGAHFASDIIWSGCMVFAVALSLYYWILRVPDAEDRLSGGLRRPRQQVRAGINVGGISALRANRNGNLSQVTQGTE